MTTSFTEFLRKQEVAARTSKVVIAEWRTAIEQLFAQIRSWLADSDPDGFIEIEERDQELREEGLGRYRVPRLDLRVFGKWIGIIPKARQTIGSAQPPRASAPER